MGHHPAEKLETFAKLLIELCGQCCAPLLPDGELTILLIDEDGKYMYEKGIDDNVHGGRHIGRPGAVTYLLLCRGGNRNFPPLRKALRQ